MDASTTASSPNPSISSRFRSLDILRGLAVLGALYVGIWTFGGFSSQQQNSVLVQGKGWNYYAYTFVDLFLNGKMRGLITLVFGAAMVIFLSKEKELGRQPQDEVFIKRQLWLVAFGIVNAFLFLFPMDYLFHLGLVGIFLFPLARFSKKTVFIAALFVLFVYCGKYFWDYSEDKRAYNKYTTAMNLEKKFEKDSIAKAKTGITVKKDTLNRQQKKDKMAWTGLLASKKIDIKKDKDNISAMQSLSYWKVWNNVVPQSQGREAPWTYRKGIWDLALMMFLGMLLYKLGFFNGLFSSRRYLLLTLVCLVGGWALGWYRLHFTGLSLKDYEKFVSVNMLPSDFFYPVEKLLLTLGYASGIMFLIAMRVFDKILYVFEAAGKMALTNYLLQSVICTILFYGYGMGYFAKLTQFQLYFVASEIILAQAVFSIIWLRYFNYGPAEWLLRRLSSGKWLPAKMRKQDTETPVPVLS